MAKKLVNDPSKAVEDAIEGLLLTNSSIARVGSLNIIVRADIATYRQTHVTLISGGGSGHEPAHAGMAPYSLCMMMTCQVQASMTFLRLSHSAVISFTH
jgi:triose/dihydroxyacetone kinase / FAD-AMP lyase (cyclizing)